MNKWTEWYNSLPEHTKKYLESQPLYFEKDLWKAAAVGAVIGFLIGVFVGFEWAWRPVVTVSKPLVG